MRTISDVNDHNALGLEIIIQSFGAVLAPDAAGLYAAEGELVIAVVKRVDPHVAGLELVDRFVSVNEIARPDRRAKTVFRGVGFFDRFIDRFERVDGQRGTEDFFFGYARVIGNVCEQRWHVEVALVHVAALGSFAAEKRLGAARLRIFDLFFDFLSLRVDMNGTHAGFFAHAVADGFLLENLYEPTDEFFSDR